MQSQVRKLLETFYLNFSIPLILLHFRKNFSNRRRN